MFLGWCYLFVHWDSCSQIPQNKHIWEHWACTLKTRAWRCTSASKRQPQAVFLRNQEKSACDRFLTSVIMALPSPPLKHQLCLQQTDIIYYIWILPLLWDFNINFVGLHHVAWGVSRRFRCTQQSPGSALLFFLVRGGNASVPCSPRQSSLTEVLLK